MAMYVDTENGIGIHYAFKKGCSVDYKFLLNNQVEIKKKECSGDIMQFP